ncbi:hypothetical protein M426DRAFT_25484 [Hypoxylon sp. CI-4A]|nr:hypothetical protein M426DRAFT_25484 [Hypoxylon sp. CI-4A]
MASTSEPFAPIQGLPFEMLLAIMSQIRPSDLFNFVTTDKWFYKFFTENRHTILHHMFSRLPEFKSLLYLITSSSRELHPGRMLHPRVVDYVGDGSTTIRLMKPDCSPDKFLPLFLPITTKRLAPKYMVGDDDLDTLWHYAKVVDWWVETYPSLVWRDSPTQRRSLRGYEETRLRKAIGRWWLYAHFFHGFIYESLGRQVPKRWESDARLQHLRVLSTAEIQELADFWDVISETVSKDVCASPERVCSCEHGSGVDLVPWGYDDGPYRHEAIMRTYMKLDPEQLRLQLTEFCYQKKSDIISTMNQRCPAFRHEIETLSMSITKALEERVDLNDLNNPSLSFPSFGIMDPNRRRAHWDLDRWTAGRIPLHRSVIDAFPFDSSMEIPEGDDGSNPWRGW